MSKFNKWGMWKVKRKLSIDYSEPLYPTLSVAIVTYSNILIYFTTSLKNLITYIYSNIKP